MRIDLLRKQARHVVNNVSLYQDADNDEMELEDIWFEDENSDVFNHLAQQRSRKQIHDPLKILPDEQTEVLATVKSRVRLALNKLKLVVDR